MAKPYGKATWQGHMAVPYGKAIWQCHMAEPYGKAIWQSHMAKPYGKEPCGSRGRGCRRGRGLCFALAGKTLSGILPLKNDMQKKRNCMFLRKIKLFLHIWMEKPSESNRIGNLLNKCSIFFRYGFASSVILVATLGHQNR